MAARATERVDPETDMLPSHRLDHGIHIDAGGGDVRGTTNAVVGWAMTGREEQAWRSLERVLECQDDNPASLTYGNFKWHTNWDMARDPNAASFMVPLLAYVRRRRGAAMPAGLRDRLDTALAASVDALNAHRATWEYTNIALLNMAAKLAVGDVLDLPRATALAGWDWEEWRNHCSRLGTIPEHNSLAYTGVQIHALAIMLTCRAPAAFHREVRQALRHLVAAALGDYHPGVGRLTGPMSRGAYRDRGGSYMDLVLALVREDPLPAEPVLPWIGAPLGTADILPAVRDLPLPRWTRVASHGHQRRNYLGADYALGSTNGRAGWTGHEIPWTVAWTGSERQCVLPVRPQAYAATESWWTVRRENALLATALWYLDEHTDRFETATPAVALGNLSGLATGRPGRLVADPDFRPGYRLDLGRLEGIELTRREAHIAVVRTPSVLIGLRGAGSWCLDEADGLTTLCLDGERDGIRVTARERAVICPFHLVVEPAGDPEALADRLASTPMTVSPGPAGWTVETGGFTLAVDGSPNVIYEVAGAPVSANMWAMSLAEES